MYLPLKADDEGFDVNCILRDNNYQTATNLLSEAAYGRDFSVNQRPPVPNALWLLKQVRSAVEHDLQHQLGQDPTLPELRNTITAVMNQHYAFLCEVDCVAFRSTCRVTGMVIFDYAPAKKWKDSLRNLRFTCRIQTAGGKQKTSMHLPKVWLEHPGCRTYSRLVFNPYPRDHPSRGPRENELNSWEGWAFSEAELRDAWSGNGDYKIGDHGGILTRDHHAEAFEVAGMFQNHLFEIICDGDLEKFQFITAFLAAKIRRPWFRPDVAVVVTGNEGCGKSSFFEMLLQFFGPAGAKCNDIDHLVGNFNHEFKHKLFIFLDEASWNGNIKGNNALKNFITSDMVSSEQKYHNRETCPNYAALVMTSNDRHVIRQGDHARRYAFFPAKLHSHRLNAGAHARYFTDMLGGLQAHDHWALKIWIQQFYDKKLYPDYYLDAFGRFNVNKFPTACITEMESQKPFSHGIVTKFWHRVIRRGFVYPPVFDYVLNSTDPAEHLFETHEGDPLVFPDGRRPVDLADPGTAQNLVNIMRNTVHPVWITPWLGTIDTHQAYNEFMEMKKTDLVPAKGVDQRVDYTAFCHHTALIFPKLSDQGRIFEARVRGEWISRSNQRKLCSDNTSWMSIKDDDGTRGHPPEIHTFYSIGSLQECYKEFFIFSGIDLSRDRELQAEAMEGKPSIYDDDWAEYARKYFFRRNPDFDCGIFRSLRD